MSDETIHFQGDTIRGDIIQRQMAELTALRARLAQAEAENAVMVDALAEIADAARELDEDDFDVGACGQLARDAIDKASEGARRLLDVVEAAREARRLLGFMTNAKIAEATALLARALSRHGNPAPQTDQNEDK